MRHAHKMVDPTVVFHVKIGLSTGLKIPESD